MRSTSMRHIVMRNSHEMDSKKPNYHLTRTNNDKSIYEQVVEYNQTIQSE